MTDKWISLGSRELLRVGARLRVYTDHVRLPDGREVADYLQIDMPAFVAMVALTREGSFLLERHYKHGLKRVILTLPAGTVDPGEPPLAAAQRELIEETGYAGALWQPLFSSTMHANAGGAVGHAFLVRGCVQQCEPDSGDLEEMTIETKSADEILQALADGEMPLMSDRGIILQAFLELGLLKRP
jgi:ADP-ribose pyrophosphatase